MTQTMEQTSQSDEAIALAYRVAHTLAHEVPAGWQRLDAEFAMTIGSESARVLATDESGPTSVEPSHQVIELVRAQRAAAALAPVGPWWRLILSITAEGAIDIDYDFGEEPFPQEQIFTPDAYAADLAAYPRERLPVWLAAHIEHRDRQLRTPARAAAQARAQGARATVVEDELPEFPDMWARWATIAAAFVAAGSPQGPRMMPAVGWFEGADRCGATLFTVPGGRAVLSGGIWEAPALDAAYNDGGTFPDVFAGAPSWVANPVLNPRAAAGLLSFCFWWDGRQWHRGESPAAAECAPAIPGVWSDEAVMDIVSELADKPGRAALKALTAAAHSGHVTVSGLTDVFGVDGVDIDSARYQYFVASLAADLENER